MLGSAIEVLHLLCSTQMDLNLRAALGAPARLRFPGRLCFGDRHIKFVGIVLVVPTRGTVDTHSHNHGDLLRVHERR